MADDVKRPGYADRDLRVTAVVFDWAGTTVDFGCMAPVEAFRELMGGHGIEVADGDIRAFMGRDKREHVRLVLGVPAVADQWERQFGSPPGDDEVQALYEELEPLLEAAVVRHAEPITGLPGLTARLRSAGIRIGSTTGYISSTMETLAPAAGARGYRPDAVVTPDQVPAGRPAPFMCYRNALELGTCPLHTMVKVGDTLADIEEGRNAGMWTVGVALGGSDLGLSREEADALPPNALEDRIWATRRCHLRAGAHYSLRTVTELEAVIADINRKLASGGHPALDTPAQRW